MTLGVSSLWVSFVAVPFGFLLLTILCMPRFNLLVLVVAAVLSPFLFVKITLVSLPSLGL